MPCQTSASPRHGALGTALSIAVATATAFGLALALTILSAPAIAASSASSAASEGLSASVGGSSTSIEKSSQSSSGKNDKVAEGRYRIVDIAEARSANGAPERLRLTLAPESADGESFVLILPLETIAAGRLDRGDTVLATHRTYGVEFARGDTRQAFFLVVDDAWQRDLRTTPVKG